MELFYCKVKAPDTDTTNSEWKGFMTKRSIVQSLQGNCFTEGRHQSRTANRGSVIIN